jgi:hypothetical protein
LECPDPEKRENTERVAAPDQAYTKDALQLEDERRASGQKPFSTVRASKLGALQFKLRKHHASSVRGSERSQNNSEIGELPRLQPSRKISTSTKLRNRIA